MTQSQGIVITVDGVEVKTQPGKTIIQAVMEAGLYIPYLCYYPGMKPFGACRMCVVEIENQRGTPASCTTPVANGMVVKTNSPQVKDLRKNVMELLLSEHPHGCLTCHRIELCGPQDICLRHVSVNDRCVICPKNERCELKDTVRLIGMDMETPLTYKYRNLPLEVADPFYDRDYNLCIVCARCTRVCEEVRGDSAITMVDRAGQVLVGTSYGTSLLESGCEFCGACVDVCPVGALVERDYKWEKKTKEVYTTCPHCPVGCQVKLEVGRRDRVIRSIGDVQGPSNRGQLCFKGKFGMDFVNHKKRLKRPLVRRNGALQESSWEEALQEVAKGFEKYKGDGFAALASPRSTNEESYLLQKFARRVMGTNSVDVSSDTRPELVEALSDSLGIMAATNSIWELEGSATVLVVNSNITEEHNVVAVPIKKAHKAGQKLVVIDSREVELTRYADIWLRPLPGTEVALLGGIIKVIVDEALEDKEFVAQRCAGFHELERALWHFDLLQVESTTRVPRQQIQEAARLFARNRPGAVLYALDNLPQEQRTPLVHALADLALLTGNVGKTSTGIYPLRSGANEQGAWDVGCVPSLLPGYRKVDDPQARQEIGRAWGVELPLSRGLGVGQVFSAIKAGSVRAMQILGDSPNFTSQEIDALSRLEFLVVQDNFLSEVSDRAQVVLPSAAFAESEGSYTNLERRVQLLRKAVGPKGESQADWTIICQIAKNMGARGFDFESPAQVMDEIASLVPQYRGISHKALEAGGIQWPCQSPNHTGTPILYSQASDGQGFNLMPVQPPSPLPKLTTDDFPLLLVPGRVLLQSERKLEILKEGSLNTIKREEILELSAEDAERLGVREGDLVEAVSARGKWRGKALLTGSDRGIIYTSSLFGELAVMLEKSQEPDPMLKVPGLHIVPVRLERVEGQPVAYSPNVETDTR